MTDLFESQFIALLERGLVGFVELLPAPEGWYVRINGFQWLRTRECPHRFDRLEKTLAYLRELGCSGVMVHLNVWPDAS
ncbi:hypothetical protein [Cupriavidus sp. BIC8F]|uniref:hypothetical protein n=1 Tax=Cupriavidus sp. BIC8F TaxID=3079014 RepID=UPI002916E514|nr:hypothetical protein [Cupriavidus sp. BIC8F]